MFDRSTDTPTDEVYDVLANRRRRRLLYYLHDRGGEADLWEVARDVAAAEMDCEPAELDRDDVNRVYISLYQTHVPRLADGDVVDYDDESKTIRLARGLREVRAVLDRKRESGRSWSGYYALVGVTLASLVVAVELQLVRVGDPVLSTLTFAAVAALLVVALSHYYATRVRRFDDEILETLKG